MQTAANNILFFTGCSSFKQLADLCKTTNHGAFYQQIALEIIKGCGSRQLLSDFAEQLITVADRAYFLRRKDIVKQASQILLNLDRRYEAVALFYQAMSFKREGGLDKAHALMGRVADTASPGYKERAILSLGTFYYETGDYQSASQFYAESSRAQAKNRQPNLITAAQTQWMIAVLKSVDGDHDGALADLIRLKPVILTISSQYPHFYYDYLNSLAVELGELGRMDEALTASRVAVTSPYAAAYPELRETLDELTEKSRRPSRSTIAVSLPVSHAENVVSLTAVQRTLYGGFNKYEAVVPHRARVFKFKDYIKLIKETRRAEEDEAGLEAAAGLKEARLEGLRRLTTKQKLLRIIELMSDDGITDNKLLRILLVLEKIEEGCPS